MKIWTKIEWAIIVAASVLLLFLLILFAYSHPHSDDFSYYYFLTHRNYADASAFVYNYSGGRFFSTILIFFNPLLYNSITGYQWLTASFFVCFVFSLFCFLYIILFKATQLKSIVFLFAFLLLAFCSFLPNIHEFAYWLCAEATYLLAVTLWLWSIILHSTLANTKHQNKWWLWLLLAVNTVALVGCSEVAMMINFIPWLLHYLYRYQYLNLSHKGFWITTILFFGVCFIVSFSGGNISRHGLTPFSGNVFLAISGGFYSAAFWLSKWAIVFVGVVCFYILIFGHRLKEWTTMIRGFKIFKSKVIFVSSIIFFLMVQILVVWMSGSTPEMRFENVLFFLLLISFLFSAQLLMNEQSDFFDMLTGKLHRGFKTLSFIYLFCIFIVVPNNAVNAMFDVLSGSAYHYNQENKQRYLQIKRSKDSIVAVLPIIARPQILYFPTLTCNQSPDPNDLPRLCLANYFGKKWIYEYPCNTELPNYSIKEILKQKRQQFFSKEKK
jgi:hypothetical protein